MKKPYTYIAYDHCCGLHVEKLDGEEIDTKKAYDEMIEELLAQRRTLFMQLSGLNWLENKKADIGSYVQNNREIIESRIKCNETALKKAGCTND